MIQARNGHAASGLFGLGRDDEQRVEADRTEGAGGACTVLTAADIPDRLALPAFPFDGDGFSRVQVQLIRCDGRLLALGFTTAELLIERLGASQPWIGMPGPHLVRLLDESGIAGLVVDPAASLLDRLWTPEALDALKRINDVRL